MINFNKSVFIFLLIGLHLSCHKQVEYRLDDEVLASMGSKFRISHTQSAEEFKTQLLQDSTNVAALLGLAETNVILFIFGYTSREQTIPFAKRTLKQAEKLDSTSAEFHRLTGMLHFLDWNWSAAEIAFQKAVRTDPQNLAARHWYSLYLAAMGQSDASMAQSDTIMTMDPNEDYLVGRGSLLYFQHRFAELRDLMQKTIARDTTIPWGYDWLGMAYNGLEQHKASISTYLKAFDLSDGTVEVGAGLGHALALGGEVQLARQMAEFYTRQAKVYYLPPVQRSFIHLGLGEYDQAIELLEQAFNEKSWFLIFIKIEPWYDPVRGDKRFAAIIERMKFP